VPVVARRTEKRLALAAAKRVERWQRIAREAAEQSRRAAPPEIHGPLKLKDALNIILADTSSSFHPAIPPDGFSPSHSVIPTEGFSPSRGTGGSDLRIVFAESERKAALGEILRAQDNVTSLALAIGPEGGWTPEELHLFQQSRWTPASLGDTILRAETAAIAALAVARAEL
jgi:16S rRNA (uracil1498-N3)-methyltransferase